MDPVDSHASDIMRIISQTRAIEAETDAIKRGFAHILYERLMKEIAEYEAGLNADEEIGAFLSSFGSEIIIQIQDVRYRNPYFIVFEGINTNDGTRVKLVQHVSQVSVLFTAIKIRDLERKPRRIGFATPQEPDEVSSETDGKDSSQPLAKQ